MSMFRIPRRSPRRQRNHAQTKPTLQLELLEMRCVLNGSFTSISIPQNIGGQSSNGLGTLLLLSDGTVLAHETEQPGGSLPYPTYTGSKVWWRLSPGPTGSYQSGTSWTQVSSMTYERAFFSAHVLPSGNVLVLGSECPKDRLLGSDWKTVELFDPVANTWVLKSQRDSDPLQAPYTVLDPDGTGTSTYSGYIGAEATKILPFQADGHTRLLVLMEGSGILDVYSHIHPLYADSKGYVNQIFDVDATTNAWSRPTYDRNGNSYLDRGTSGTEKAQAGEECSVLLPPTTDAQNGSILTTDSSFQWENLTTRRYIPPDASYPDTGHWVTAGTLPPRSPYNDEIRDGPAVLLPATLASNEKVWATGQFGHTAYYSITNNTWSAGPDFPTPGFSVAPPRVAWDTPAAVLPTGQVLIVSGSSPQYDSSGHPLDYYPAPYTVSEFTPSTQTFADLKTGPTAGAGTVSEILINAQPA